MLPASCRAVVVACAVFLFGGLWSAGGAREVSLTYEPNVPERRNRHDALLTPDHSSINFHSLLITAPV
jgi:hypothetical protein